MNSLAAFRGPSVHQHQRHLFLSHRQPFSLPSLSRRFPFPGGTFRGKHFQRKPALEKWVFGELERRRIREWNMLIMFGVGSLWYMLNMCNLHCMCYILFEIICNVCFSFETFELRDHNLGVKGFTSNPSFPMKRLFLCRVPTTKRRTNDGISVGDWWCRNETRKVNTVEKCWWTS